MNPCHELVDFVVRTHDVPNWFLFLLTTVPPAIVWWRCKRAVPGARALQGRKCTPLLRVADMYSCEPARQQYLFEQYKLYVDIADRISARRATAHTLFLAVETALMAAVILAVSSTVKPDVTARWALWAVAVILLVGGGAVSVVWLRITQSYIEQTAMKAELMDQMEARGWVPVPLWFTEFDTLGVRGHRSKARQELALGWVFLAVQGLLLAVLVGYWCGGMC